MDIGKSKFSNWYKENLGKIVLIFIILVIFTLTVVYIPYLNVLFSPAIGFLVVFLSWYFLFRPSTYILVILEIIALCIALVSALLEVGFLAEAVGEFLYVSLVLIAFNFITDFFEERKNTEIK